MLLAFTLLSCPAYVLFWSGASAENPNQASDEGMTFADIVLGLSLGNLGDKQWHINELRLNKAKQRVQLLCTTGVIGNLRAYGAARVNFDDDDIIVDYDEETYCELEAGVKNSRVLEQKCFGEKFCTIPWLIDSDDVFDECERQDKIPSKEE